MKSKRSWGHLRVQGHGRGKLLLFGEHAAVHGYPALGVAMPWSTMVNLSVEGRDEWNLESVEPEDRPALSGLLKRMERLFPSIVRWGRGSVGIKSDVPRAVGFGSSAALCVALVDAAASLPLDETEECSERDRWRWAHELERQFHGTPSGIDTGLAVLGGMHLFWPHPPDLPDEKAIPAGGLCLIVGAVERTVDTKTLVGRLSERVRAGEKEVLERFRRLGQYAEEAAGILESGKDQCAEAVGVLADKAHKELAALGLSTAELELLLKAGRQAHALGGKLSGAGGGGAFFLVARDPESARGIAEKVSAEARAHGIELQGPLVFTLEKQPA